MSLGNDNNLMSIIVTVAVGMIILGVIGGIAINIHQDASNTTETIIEVSSDSFDHNEAQGRYDLQNTPAVEIHDLQEPEGPTFLTSPGSEEFEVSFDEHPQAGDAEATIYAETTAAQPAAEIHIIDKGEIDNPATYDPTEVNQLNNDDRPTHQTGEQDTYTISLDTGETFEESQLVQDKGYIFGNEVYTVLLYNPLDEEVLNQDVNGQEQYATVQQPASDSDGMYNYPEHSLEDSTTLQYNPEPVFAYGDLTVTYDYEETTTTDGFDDGEVDELWDITPVAFLLAIILGGIAMAVKEFQEG